MEFSQQSLADEPCSLVDKPKFNVIIRNLKAIHLYYLNKRRLVWGHEIILNVWVMIGGIEMAGDVGVEKGLISSSSRIRWIGARIRARALEMSWSGFINTLITNENNMNL